MMALVEGRAADPRRVETMCDAQRHRGPDDAGLWHSRDRRVALGHRRLSIIDLSPSGHQPMHDTADSLHIVFNGEIYNFGELRVELEKLGHAFRTHSDTEVILVGYRQWGLGVLDRLVGMFAFGIHDSATGELLLARDPLGIKPVYYIEAEGELSFASEVGALRAVVDCGDPDPRAIAEYLMWGSIGAPRTLHSRVHALPPGSWLRVRGGRVDGPHAYYRIEDEIGRIEPMDGVEAARYVRECLLASVRRHRIADVEVGAFLSGGVDSVALVGLMTEVSDRPITSVNLSFQREALDEGPISELAASLYGARHHRIPIRVDEIRERLVAAVGSLDQPSIDGINVYFVSEAAVRAGLKVAISGVGGDELFAGYSTFDAMAPIQRAQSLLDWLPGMAKLRDPLSRMLPRILNRQSTHKAAMVLRHGHSWPGAYFAQRGLFSFDQTTALLSPAVRAAARDCLPETHMAARVVDRDLPESERVSLYEIRQYLQSQLLRDTDAMSMRHSLEVRTPLVDRQLVSELFRIPTEHRHARPAKKLFREAVRPPVPPQVWARKKQGFNFPIDEWIKEGSLPMSLPDHPVLDREAVAQVEIDYRAGRLHWSRYWAMLILGTFLSSQ